MCLSQHENSTDQEGAVASFVTDILPHLIPSLLILSHSVTDTMIIHYCLLSVHPYPARS